MRRQPAALVRTTHKGLMTPQAIRESLMEAAGITTEVKTRIVRRVIASLSKKLTAKRKHVVSYLGKVTQVIEMEDNMAQLRAAESLALLMGIEPSKDVNAQNVKVIVEVNLPDWAKPAIDITPAHLDGEGLIDATP